MTGGKGVQLIYACLGVGVTCFWLAFVVANKGGWTKKLIWVIGGALCIWVINVVRISLFLIAINKQQQMPFGVDNHTFFDVLAYVAIFILMFFYDRSFRKDNKV
jgi:exosortase/archaeosortase family protein